MPNIKEVWFYQWGFICSGEITGSEKDNRGRTYHNIHITSIAGERTGGKTGCFAEECYNTKEECEKARKAASDKAVQEYKNEIQDVQSLIQFCLDHQMLGEDYDDDARRVVVEKAVELGFRVQD